MTISVSISQFRENLSEYLAKVDQGHKIVLKDEKRDKNVARLIPEKTFDPVTFQRTLRRAVGLFTAKNHPEWRTKRQVIQWVEKGRAAADRTF